MNLFHARRVALSCSAALLMMGCGAAGAASAAADAGHDVSGVWWIEHYEPTLVPMDGAAVPYTPEGKAEYDKNVAALQGGAADPALKICLLQGIPRAMLSAYPLKIVQHERTVTFIHEQNHAFWHAIVGIPHDPKPDDIDLAFMGGESVAKWEGDTLVVDSLGFKLRTYLDEAGMPHDEDLHLVQRLRKIDGGKELEDLITIEDPKLFTHAWTARRTYVWSPEVHIMEYVCGEPHRALWGDRAKALHLHFKPL